MLKGIRDRLLLKYTHIAWSFFITTVLFFFEKFQIVKITLSIEAAVAVLAVVAIFIGFTGTIQTLIITTKDSQMLEKLKKLKTDLENKSYYDLYVESLNNSLFWGFIAVAYNLCAIVLAKENLCFAAVKINKIDPIVYSMLWIFVTSLTITSFYFSLSSYCRIIKNP